MRSYTLCLDSDTQIVPSSTGMRLSNDVGDEIGTRDYRSIAVHLSTVSGERPGVRLGNRTEEAMPGQGVIASMRVDCSSLFVM